MLIKEIYTSKEYRDIVNKVTPEEFQVSESSENEEISISYVTTGKRWNRQEIVVDNIFAYNVALNIIKESEEVYVYM